LNAVTKVLVVDDSALMRRLLGNIFRSQENFTVELARDGMEALAKAHEFRPDVMTLDVHMPNMDGLECLDRIMIECPTRVIMVSSLTSEGADKTFEAMQLGAVDFVAKPNGAPSLAIDELAPVLLEKVRAAAKQRLRCSSRLAERVRYQTRMAATSAVYAAELGLQKNRTTAPAHELAADCVVLVGSSTGGPPALDALLSPLPADFPWPIVVAQHMPASFTGPLAKRLNRLCALTVEEVTSATPLTPGHVYIGKGDADVIIVSRGDRSHVTAVPPMSDYRWHPSVDRLVTTAIQHLGPARLIGVLLTGMGNDGATTMAQLRLDGGRTIAESEATAVVWGMPGELVKAGGADVVAPLESIAGHLTEWAR
jgi:two-component system, chemotaxis family, protein-glutamate methylesterase/glutaminase